MHHLTRLMSGIVNNTFITILLELLLVLEATLFEYHSSVCVNDSRPLTLRIHQTMYVYDV